MKDDLKYSWLISNEYLCKQFKKTLTSGVARSAEACRVFPKQCEVSVSQLPRTVAAESSTTS